MNGSALPLTATALATSPPALRWSAVRGFGLRVARAEACWIIIGMLVGAVQRASVGPGIIDAAASMIAGAIVLGIVGGVIAVFGGRGRDALAGAVLGSLVGLLTVGCPGASSRESALGAGIIVGALVASTGWPMVCTTRAVVAAGSSVGTLFLRKALPFRHGPRPRE